MYEDLDVDWFVWRVVVSKLATLREIDEHWTIKDLIDANAILDTQDAVAMKQNLEQKQRVK